MHWHPAHGDGLARMRAARGERNIKGRGRCFGIIEEEFVEISHPEEQQGVGVFGFERKPLRHGGCGAFGRWKCHVWCLPVGWGIRQQGAQESFW
ncbi:hypothetical protein KOXY103107_16335 [Komagataeibacter xylinus]